MAVSLIDKIRIKFPPHKDWRFQRQTEPPTFGWARLVNETALQAEVSKRHKRCSEIIRNSGNYCDYDPGKVSLIVLSCRRKEVLKRLIKSMKSFFTDTEHYPKIEKILVDNGSGTELIEEIAGMNFFDMVIRHPDNIGMVNALKDAYRKARGEYIAFVEDDFILDYDKPFMERALSVFNEYPEIGIIRLKDQNNWWKPYRIIAPIRKTRSGAEFWTWLPSKNNMLNIWSAGSVIFRKASYFSTGELPEAKDNMPRSKRMHQGYIYECIYGKEYNRYWLSAKLKNCSPFFQPNMDKECTGWGNQGLLRIIQ